MFSSNTVKKFVSFIYIEVVGLDILIIDDQLLHAAAMISLIL
jgi:hypothetical protein